MSTLKLLSAGCTKNVATTDVLNIGCTSSINTTAMPNGGCTTSVNTADFLNAASQFHLLPSLKVTIFQMCVLLAVPQM